MLLVAYKLLAILLSFLFLGHALFIKKTVGTFIFPASLMSLAWFFYTFIPLIFLFNIPINPIPILYIFLCVLAFSLGALPFKWGYAFSQNKLKDSSDEICFQSKFMRTLFYFSAFFAITFTTLVITSTGIQLSEIILSLRETSGRFALMRVGGKLNYGLYGILSFFFTYLTSILGGLAFHNDPNLKRRVLIFIITFIPTIYFMLAQSAKIIIFYSIGFYIAAFLLRKIYSNMLDLFNWKMILKVMIFALIIIPLILISISSRHEITQINELSIVSLKSIVAYTLGQVYAFCDYFSFYIGMESTSKYIHDLNSYGRYTFTSIYTMAGGTKNFPPGTFYDYYNYNNFIMTNIYTIFRGLINDFGVVGTVFFMFFSGLFIHAFFYRLLVTRVSHLSNAIFIISVVYIEGTYLISVFMARYMYLILIALITIFWINQFYIKKERYKC